MSKSELEVAFLRMWDICSKLNNVEPVAPEAEYKFAVPRKWRFDYAWPSHKVAVELEGGVWTQGRHSRPTGMIGDMDKYNTAAKLGWLVLRFTGSHLKNDPLTVWETIIETLNTNRSEA
jgi:very-short-patch-repair endonuclease